MLANNNTYTYVTFEEKIERVFTGTFKEVGFLVLAPILPIITLVLGCKYLAPKVDVGEHWTGRLALAVGPSGVGMLGWSLLCNAFDCNKFPELAEKYHPKVNDTSLSFFNISFDSKFNQTNGDAIVNGEELLERAMLDTVLLAGQNQTKTTTVLSKITVSSHVQAVHNLFAIFGPLLTAVTIMPIVAVFLAKYLTCWDGIRLIKGHHEQAFINGEWVTLSYSEPSYLDLTKCHLVNGIIIGTIASGGLAAGLYIAESKLGYFEDNYITQYTTNTTTTKNLTWQSYELDLQNPLVDNVAMEHYQ